MNVRQLRHLSHQVFDKDIESSMGVIECDGDLVVHGNVQDESLIYAAGDVTVEGYVGSAVVRSARSIQVLQGVAGQGYLDAGQDITVNFTNNSRLVAGRNIRVLTSAMHSLLCAEGDIQVEGNAGFFVGGSATALGQIIVTRVGSVHGTPTMLRVGVSPIILNELRRLVAEVESLEKRLEATRKDVLYLENVSEQCPHDERLPLYRLRASYLQCELSKQYKRYQMTQGVLRQARPQGHVWIHGCGHAGVTLHIGWEQYTLDKTLEHVHFYEGKRGIEWAGITSLDETANAGANQ